MNLAKKQQQIEMIEKMGATWPSEIIARKQIGTFTGGMMSPRTLANLDCLGVGPAGVVKIGNTVGYSKRSLLEWLIAKLN